MTETKCFTENALADWMSTARKNDLAIYFAYRHENEKPIAFYRDPAERKKHPEIASVADYAVRLRDLGFVAIAQRRNGEFCEYVAQRR